MKEPIKIIMLPTEDESTICKSSIGLHFTESMKSVVPAFVNQHLYITVSQNLEPIKEGDWYIEPYVDIKPTQCKSIKEVTPDDRKIIANTDPKLNITNSATGYTETRSRTFTSTKPMPQLQQSFLKEFVANPDGKWEVEYKCNITLGYFSEQWESTYNLKLNQDNTVNITSVEEKIYSVKEVEELLIKHQSDYRSHVRKSYPTNWSMDIKKWIKENLK